MCCARWPTPAGGIVVCWSQTRRYATSVSPCRSVRRAFSRSNASPTARHPTRVQRMATYVLRRLLLAGSVVVAVSFAAFVGFGLSLDPSFPLAFKPRDQAVVRAAYHLTDPILARYWRWASGLVHHGFGTTVSTTVVGAPPRLAVPGDPIGPGLLHATAVSAVLVALALVFVVLGSTAVGAFAAERRR